MTTQLKSIVASSVAWVVSLFVLVAPAVALACPGYASSSYQGHTACGGSSTAGYAGAVGVGLIAGMVSVVIEAALKKRNK